MIVWRKLLTIRFRLDNMLIAEGVAGPDKNGSATGPPLPVSKHDIVICASKYILFLLKSIMCPLLGMRKGEGRFTWA